MVLQTLLSDMIINEDASPAVDTALEDNSYDAAEQARPTPHGIPCGIDKASCSVSSPHHIRNRIPCPDTQGWDPSHPSIVSQTQDGYGTPHA